MGANRRYSLGIRIEGIGDDTAKTGGICWYWGNKLTSAQNAASNLEWIGGWGSRQGLASIPGNVSSDVDPHTADLRLGSHTFEIHYEAFAVAVLLAPPAIPTEALNESLTPGETAIKLTDGFDANDNGTVAWFGDEAVLLGTYNGTDEFNLCTRGYWGTQARTWDFGVEAFKRNPFVLHRQIQLIRFDHADDSETVMDRLFLEEIGTSSDGTKLVLRCRDIISALSQARINLGSPDLAATSDWDNTGVFVQVQYDRDGNGQLVGAIGPPRFRVQKSGGEWGCFQVGDGAYSAEYLSSANAYLMEDGGTHSRPVLDGPQPDPETLEPIYELIYVNRRVDTIGDDLRPLDERRSSTANADLPFHPMTLPLAYFRSSEDVLDASKWDLFVPINGLATDDDWFDDTDITATLDATAGIEIDQYIAGYDGEEIVPWDEFKQLCRAYGFFPAKTNAGQITIKHFRDATIQDVALASSVTAIPFTLEWFPSTADAVDVISGKYGELPWRDGVPYLVQHVKRSTVGDDPVPARSKRKGLFAQQRELVFDQPTRNAVDQFSSDLAMLAVARSFAAPRIKLKVLDVGFGHGEFVRIATLPTVKPWIVDNDGTLVRIDTTSAKWIGLVVSKRSNLLEGTADIQLLLTNHGSGRFARYRAPAAVIESFSTTTMTLQQNQFVDTGDGLEFNTGDIVALWSESGFLRSTQTKTITGSTAAHSLVMDTAWDVDPVKGDVIRLAELGGSGYPETGHSNYQAGDPIDGFDGFLVYTFMADNDDEIGPNNLEGHVYGVGSA